MLSLVSTNCQKVHFKPQERQQSINQIFVWHLLAVGPHTKNVFKLQLPACLCLQCDWSRLVCRHTQAASLSPSLLSGLFLLLIVYSSSSLSIPLPLRLPLCPVGILFGLCLSRDRPAGI